MQAFMRRQRDAILVNLLVVAVTLIVYGAVSLVARFF